MIGFWNMLSKVTSLRPGTVFYYRNLFRQAMFEIKNNGCEEVELWNKGLLGFFLAVHNLQIKTANLFLKSFDLLRLILHKICPNRFAAED